MKIKAALLFLTILSALLFSGCVPDKGDVNPGTNSGNSDIPDEDALNGLKTAAADAERIGVISENLTIGTKNRTQTFSSADNTLIGWGLGRDRDSLGRPIDAVKAQEKYGAHSALFIDASGEKNLYLTFDEDDRGGRYGRQSQLYPPQFSFLL